MTKKRNKMINFALKYAEKGFSVIPVNAYKKAMIPWNEYKTRHPSKNEIDRWWLDKPYSNIGIITGKISGICVIDIDSEEGEQNIREYVHDLMIVPTAITPGGGRHLYFKMPEKEINNNVGLIPGCDFRGEGGYIIAPPSKAFSSKIKRLGEYKWEISLDDAELLDLPEKYLSTIVHPMSTNVYQGPQLSTKIKMFSEGRRDNDLFHVANCLIKGGMPEDEVYQIISSLSLICDPPFSQKEAIEKVNSVLKRINRTERNLTQEIREYVMSTKGHFLSTDVYRDLHLFTRREKKTASQIFSRLIEDETIERRGNKNGCFELIDKTLEKLNWEKALGEEFDIYLPFNLNKLVKIYPKNLIAVAGMSNSGKTAFLLNIVGMNLDKHWDKINYFSSEMSESELKNRLMAFGLDEELWKGCNFYERFDNFQDVIEPNSINIIDYLEKCKDFCEIAEDFRRIFSKLKEGIAIIAIQKHPEKDEGSGGRFTLEKPRLYLSINEKENINEIKIVKGKSWRNNKCNPNGLIKNFKIEEGYKLIELTNWE